MIVFYPANSTHSPGIYEAVSEQILLLIFKARQLYQDPEYRPRFEEQHRVLSALRANTELLRIFREQRSAEEPKLTIEESTSPNPLLLLLQMRLM